MKNSYKLLIVIALGHALAGVGLCCAMQRNEHPYSAEEALGWINQMGEQYGRGERERNDLTVQVERLRLQIEQLKTQFKREQKELLDKIAEQEETFGKSNDTLKKELDVRSKNLENAQRVIEQFDTIANGIPEKFKQSGGGDKTIQKRLKDSIVAILKKNKRLEKEVEKWKDGLTNKTKEHDSLEKKHMALYEKYEKLERDNRMLVLELRKLYMKICPDAKAFKQ